MVAIVITRGPVVTILPIDTICKKNIYISRWLSFYSEHPRQLRPSMQSFLPAPRCMFPAGSNWTADKNHLPRCNQCMSRSSKRCSNPRRSRHCFRCSGWTGNTLGCSEMKAECSRQVQEIIKHDESWGRTAFIGTLHTLDMEIYKHVLHHLLQSQWKRRENKNLSG